MSRLLKLRVGRRQGGLPPAGELGPDQPWLHWTTIIANAGNKTPSQDLTVIGPQTTTFRDSDGGGFLGGKPAGVGDSWENPWVIESHRFVSNDGGLAGRIYTTFVVFRSCTFELHPNTSSLHGVRVESGGSVRFENCTIYCPQPVNQNLFTSISEGKVDFYRCELWHGADGVRADSSNTLVEECYIHDLVPVSGTHNDMFQNHFGGDNPVSAPGNRYSSVMRSNVTLFPRGQMQTGHMLHSVSNHLTNHVFYHDHVFEGNWIAYGSAGAAFASVNPDGSRRMVNAVTRRNAFAFTMSHPGLGGYESRAGEPHWTGGTMANNQTGVLFEGNWLWVFDYPSPVDTMSKDFSSVPYDELHMKVTTAQAGNGSFQPDPLPDPVLL